MSAIVVVTCDRCKLRSNLPEESGGPDKWPRIDIYSASGSKGFDLCTSCAEQFHKFMDWSVIDAARCVNCGYQK